MTTDQGDKRKIDYEVKQVINEDCDSMDRESTRDPDEDVPDVKTHVVWNYDPETAVHEGWKRYSTAVSACEEGRQWQNALVLFLDMPASQLHPANGTKPPIIWRPKCRESLAPQSGVRCEEKHSNRD